MSLSLSFPDPYDIADLKTFVSRARAADDGVVRLQANGGTLALSVCLLRPRLLGENTPTVLGLRTVALASPTELDRTVSLAAVADRLARLGAQETELPVPDVTRSEAWASDSAPRSGWIPCGDVAADRLIEEAQRGVSEIARLLPAVPGALWVNNVRARVWGSASVLLPDLPRGAAFAGLTLGFWRPGQSVGAFVADRWQRLSAPAGHVLVRSGTI